LNDITQSPIARYLNVKDGAIFLCPSDPLYHQVVAHAGESTYQYSYSLNSYLGNGPDYHPNRNQKVVQVNLASQVIMFIDEDDRTVNDGAWLPTAPDALASRHDGQKDLSDQTARGNVIFVDGHGEFISRAESKTPSSYQPFFPTILPDAD
jgi:prepilin-type processing-associated H-X9-DG protein